MTVISASPTPIDDDQRPTPFSVESSRSCTTDSTSSIVTPSIASDDDTIILSMSTTVEDGAQVSIGGSEAEAEFTLSVSLSLVTPVELNIDEQLDKRADIA